MRANVHASCVAHKGGGIIIFGSSGSGKSDLSLRLIMEQGAKLVADDRVNLRVENNEIIATAPTILKGLLEVRGVGIIKLPAASAPLRLAVRLAASKDEIERLPEPDFYEFGSVKVPQITLYPFESSAPAKVLAALTLL